MIPPKKDKKIIKAEPKKVIEVGGHKYVYFFGEGDKSLAGLLGGKGAVLNEMTNMGIPVPSGFTITTEACKEYQKKKKLPADVAEQVSTAFSKLEEITEKGFGSLDNPLFVSVRSGAKVSMPGMMDTILNIGLNDETVKSVAKSTNNDEFAYSSYKRLMEMFADVVFGMPLGETRKYLSDTKAIAEKASDVVLQYAFRDSKNKAKLQNALISRVIEHTTKQKFSNTEELIEKLKGIDPEGKMGYADWITEAKKVLDDLKIEKEGNLTPQIGMKVKGKGSLAEAGEGVIKSISGSSIGVEFEKELSFGHILDGKAEKKKGYWCLPENLEFYPDKTLEIPYLLPFHEFIKKMSKEYFEITPQNYYFDKYSNEMPYPKKRIEQPKKDPKETSFKDGDIDFLVESIKKFLPDKKISDPLKINKEAKEGDKVEGKGEFGGKSVEGKKGAIKEIMKINGGMYGIEWKEDIDGHDLDGKAPKGHGWRVPAENITLVRGINIKSIIKEEEQKIVNETLENKDLMLEIELLKDYIRQKGKEFPQDVYEQLELAINAVFSSWNNPRAIEYRRLNQISEDLGTAANIQMMVFGNMGDDSAAGVVFTRRPTDGKKELYGEFLPNAQGEDVVAGIRTPLKMGKMKKSFPKPYKKLKGIAILLEDYFKDMQDIEFTIEKGKLWILQARKGKRHQLAALNIAVDMVKEGIISKEEALLSVDASALEDISKEMIDPNEEYDILATGSGASPGIVSGVIVLSPKNAKEIGEGKKCILVRETTSPDDIEGIASSAGVLTKTGGATSHAALVTRAMNKACITGCSELEVYDDKIVINGKEFYEGETITIDGSTGKIIDGAVKLVKDDKNPNLENLVGWAYEIAGKKILANADTPSDVRKAIANGAEEIGLCRTEHMFFIDGALDVVRDYMIAEGKEKKKLLDELMQRQQSQFEEILKEVGQKKVRVRLLSCPLSKFLPSERELGHMQGKIGQGNNSNGNKKEVGHIGLELKDKVKLRRDSPFYGQTKSWGEVGSLSRNDSFPYNVSFVGGHYSNSYELEDLDVLQLGDTVVVKSGDYAFTKAGSEGKIVEFCLDGRLKIEFYKRGKEILDFPKHFIVRAADVDVLYSDNNKKKNNQPEGFAVMLSAAFKELTTTKEAKRVKKLEEKARSKREVYDKEEMEEIYKMQVEAITNAYASIQSNAQLEVIIPDFVPSGERETIKESYASLPKGVIIGASKEVYFVKSIKEMEKDKALNAEAIVTVPSLLWPVQVLLAQYHLLRNKGGEEDGSSK